MALIIVREESETYHEYQKRSPFEYESSAVVEPWTRHPKFEGSNPAASQTGKDIGRFCSKT
jgi:hypothetical protein